MLTFFRRLITSRIGVVVALAFLVLLALVFVLQDRAGLTGGTRTATGDVIATVGKDRITEPDLRAALRRDVDRYRQQNPTLDMAQYVAGGGFEATLDQLIQTSALRQYAERQGVVISKRSIDGIIASAPTMQGIDGKFSDQAYRAYLAQQQLTDAALHKNLSEELYVRAILVPILRDGQVGTQLALPYASQLLDRRTGTIGFIPVQAFGKPTPPSDAELTAYYTRHIGQYRVPERRIFRYAIVDKASVTADATPAAAEIAKAYQAQSAKYAPAALRTIVQVVIADQATATALAAKVKAGTPIEQVARAAGLEPAAIKDVQQADYAAQANTDIAKAAFAAPAGAVIGPVRGPFGFVVARVASIRTRAGKTLAEATPELTTALQTAKTTQVLGARRNSIDDAIASSTAFGLIVQKYQLSGGVTPPLLANGIDPEHGERKPNPQFIPIVTAAFAADPGDDAQTVPLGSDGTFAIVQLDKVLPPTSRPLGTIRDTVIADLEADRTIKLAHDAAAQVTAAVNKGTPLAAALAATRLALQGTKPLSAQRVQLDMNPRGAPPPLVLLFAMRAHTAKLLEAPGKSGYFVIYLDTIEPGDARTRLDFIDGKKKELREAFPEEYAFQFTKAVQKELGIDRNAKAIAALRAELARGAVSDQ